VSDLQQNLLIPGGAPKLPAACNLSWPTKAWPPRIDTRAKLHALRQSDVPAGLREGPPTFASNAPNLNELAVGFPRAGFAEVFFSTKPAAVSGGLAVDESVGRLATPAVATSTFRADRDDLFGSCERYFPGPPLPRYALPGNPPGLFAYESRDGARGFAGLQVVIVGHRDRFVFTLSVDTYVYDPSAVTPPTAPLPPPADVTALLGGALARLAR
jgi:hypothetical protein